MFDDLDDPNGVPAGDRLAVTARAGAIRRRRRAVWAGGAASLVLVVAGVAYAVRPPSRPATVVAADDPTPEATFSETPEPTPTPTSSPTPTVDPVTVGPPTPSETESETPTPEPTPTDTPFPWDQPDGKPGWSGGFSGCAVPEKLPGEAPAPYDFLVVTADLPDSVAAAKGGRGTLTIRNDSAYYVTLGLDYGGADTTGRNVATGELTGQYFSDVISTTTVELDPGETYTAQIAVLTRMCGDTSKDDHDAPPGAYDMVAAFYWHDASASTAPRPTASPERLPYAYTPSPTPKPDGPEPVSPYGSWHSAPIRVQVT